MQHLQFFASLPSLVARSRENVRVFSQPARQRGAARYVSAVLNVSTRREFGEENKETTRAGSRPSFSPVHPAPRYPRAPYRGTMLFYGAVSLSLFHPATRWSWRWRWLRRWFLANRHTLATASASTSVSTSFSLSHSPFPSLIPLSASPCATFNLIKRGLYRTARWRGEKKIVATRQETILCIVSSSRYCKSAAPTASEVSNIAFAL